MELLISSMDRMTWKIKSEELKHVKYSIHLYYMQHHFTTLHDMTPDITCWHRTDLFISNHDQATGK